MNNSENNDNHEIEEKSEEFTGEWNPNIRQRERGRTSSSTDFMEAPQARQTRKVKEERSEKIERINKIDKSQQRSAGIHSIKPVVALLVIVCVLTGTIYGGNILISHFKDGLAMEDGLATENGLATEDAAIKGKGEQEFKSINTEEEVVSMDAPRASINGITVDFGEFGLDREQTMKVEKGAISEPEAGVRIQTYDISLEDQEEFDDVVTITLPYDQEYTQEGMEAESVCAKYYNEETGEYESIPYTVNAEENTVEITTTHFSKYSLFEVKNSYTRYAYITGTDMNRMALEDAQDIVNEFIEAGGVPGDKALEVGYNFLSESINLTSKTNTFLTLGGQLDSKFCETLDTSTRWLGLVTACVNLAVGYSSAETEEEMRKTILNAYKDLMYSSVDFLGSSVVQVQFVAVYVVDYRLNQFMTGTIEQKRVELRDVYDYYNEKFQPMSSVDWYKKFVKIYNANKDDSVAAKRLMDEEIDRYVNKFWTIDQDTLWLEVMADSNYKRMPYPNSDDMDYLKKECKQNLMQSLTAVFSRLETYVIQKIKEDYCKKLNEIKKELNTMVTFKIVDDQVSGDTSSRYTGYTVTFSPLNDNVSANHWSGKMKEDGLLQTKFTVLAYIQAGAPDEILLFEPGTDISSGDPEVTKSFQVSMPETVVKLSASTKEVAETISKLISTSRLEKDRTVSNMTEPFAQMFEQTAEIKVTSSGNNINFSVPAVSYTLNDGYDRQEITVSGISFHGTYDKDEKLTGKLDNVETIITVKDTRITYDKVEYSYTAKIKLSNIVFQRGGMGLDKIEIKYDIDGTSEITYYNGDQETKNLSQQSDSILFDYK